MLLLFFFFFPLKELTEKKQVKKKTKQNSNGIGDLRPVIHLSYMSGLRRGNKLLFLRPRSAVVAKVS